MKDARRLASWLLIATGLSLCAVSVLHYVRGIQAQARGRREIEQRAGTFPMRWPGESPGMVSAASGGHVDSASMGKPVGRLRIPSARIDYVVFEGIDESTLEKGPGHVPGTELPGRSTNRKNCVISGHRDSHFRHLGWLRKGHRIELDTPFGKKKYEVVSRQIVPPNAVRVLDPTPAPRLTLITCYPFNYLGPAPERLVVVARPIS